MGDYTYGDLGLPSIGEFTLGNMRHHRHPAVRALAGFLSNKADYLWGDRFTVNYILYLANYVDLRVHPAYACRRINLGFRPNGGLRARATAPYPYTPGDIPLFPWEVAYVPPRRQAVAAWTRRRYGERQGQQLTTHMLQQHHTFNID